MKWEIPLINKDQTFLRKFKGISKRIYMRKDNANNFSLSCILKTELQNFNINDAGNLLSGRIGVEF